MGEVTFISTVAKCLYIFYLFKMCRIYPNKLQIESSYKMLLLFSRKKFKKLKYFKKEIEILPTIYEEEEPPESEEELISQSATPGVTEEVSDIFLFSINCR